MIQVGNVSVLPEKCHGCKGKGWVAVAKKPFKCVVCEGSGVKSQYVSYPPIQTTYTGPASTLPSICMFCGQKDCTTTHASCFDGSKDFLGREVEKQQYIMRLQIN